jgi:hypothetical protein
LYRGPVVRVDDAGGAGRPEMRVAPGNGGPHGLHRKPLSLSPGGQRPADFRHAVEGGFDHALEIGEADFPDKAAGPFVFHDPVAVAQQRPMSGITQEACPHLFLGRRLSPMKRVTPGSLHMARQSAKSAIVCLRRTRRSVSSSATVSREGMEMDMADLDEFARLGAWGDRCFGRSCRTT